MLLDLLTDEGVGTLWAEGGGCARVYSPSLDQVSHDGSWAESACDLTET